METTNADRVVFPDDGLTKGDVVDYYRTVADRLLPYLSNRALTVERFPKGIGSKGFMQKNAPDHYPGELIRRHEVAKDGGTTTYPVIGSKQAIEFFANLGVITFHVPPAVVDESLRPDWIVWDLDPPEGRIDFVREAAQSLRAILDRFAIETMPMTSGSKGYHLRAKLRRTLDWGAVAKVARGTAALAVDQFPDLLTLAFRKSDRGERVFVDWLRNAPYSTSVAPWSLRARPGAPIATPLRWDEVSEIGPDDIRLDLVDQRLSADPWEGMQPLDLTSTVKSVEDSLRDAGITLEPFDRFRS